MTNTADSHTRSAPSASATKLGSPGVSSRLTLRSCQCSELNVVEIDICRACSSAAESDTVLPSGTDPSRLIDPRLEQQRLVQRRLPGPAMADEGDVANPIRCLAHDAVSFRVAKFYPANDSSCMRERSRRTALVCSWQTRDSVTPSTSPISRSVRFS